MLRLSEEEFAKLTNSDSELVNVLERICIKLIEAAGQSLIQKHTTQIVAPIAHHELKREWEK